MQIHLKRQKEILYIIVNVILHWVKWGRTHCSHFTAITTCCFQRYDCAQSSFSIEIRFDCAVSWKASNACWIWSQISQAAFKIKNSNGRSTTKDIFQTKDIFYIDSYVCFAKALPFTSWIWRLAVSWQRQSSSLKIWTTVWANDLSKAPEINLENSWSNSGWIDPLYSESEESNRTSVDLLEMNSSKMTVINHMVITVINRTFFLFRCTMLKFSKFMVQANNHFL